MLTAKFKITGISDLMFGRYVPEKKKDGETHDQYEERTWQQKCAMDDAGHLYLNGFAVKNGLEHAAKWLGRKIPGEGKKTYTARFASGIIPSAKIALLNGDGKTPMTIKCVEPVRLFVPSDGKRGSGSRVFRIFPTVHSWSATGELTVFDGKLTAEVIEDHMRAMGQFGGLGAMRVQNGGVNGRFTLDKLECSELTM